MATTMTSADAQHLMQLRLQLAQMNMREQTASKIAESQQAALMATIEDVAALETQNVKLRQNLLLTLRLLQADSGDAAVKAQCAFVAGSMGLLPPQGGAANGPLNAAVPAGPITPSRFFKPEPAHSPPALTLQPPPTGGAGTESPSSEEGLMAVTFAHGAPVQLGPSTRQDFGSDHSSEQAEDIEKASTISTHAPKQPRDEGNLVWPENSTTVLIRNMPPRSSMEDLIKAFPPDGSYDLVHLPFNIKTRRTSSFATINFITAELAGAFRERFHGQHLPHSTRSKDPLIIMPAKVQGLEANLAFLLEEKGVAEMRNSALLPRLYLAGAAASQLVSTGPKCILQPDEPGQPNRLDFRQVLEMLNNADEI